MANQPWNNQPKPQNQQQTVKATNNYGFGNNGVGPVQSYTDKNAEIQRTVGVLQNRQNAGMDVSNQMSWYRKLTGTDYVPQSNKPTVQQPQAPKQPSYAFNTYTPTANVNEQYINKARGYNISAGKNEPYQGFVGNQFQAGSLLDNDRLRELAYYLQLQDDVIGRSGELYRNAMNAELSKGFGLRNDWAVNNQELQDLYRQQWAIQDFIADKYGINHQNDVTVQGLSRKDLGFNAAGDFTTLEERIAKGIQDDPWGVNSSYFNDLRHKGQRFSYMDYFDPSAYEWQREQAEDGRDIEYWYNTNFAREHGYVDDNWDYNANNFADWRNLQHQDFVNKYGVGGTNWGGNQANLDAYNSMVAEILGGDDRMRQLMQARQQALNPQSQQVQQLREIMAANGLYDLYRG